MLRKDWVYRRGDLYLADLGRADGSRQSGIRPVILLQNDVANYYAPTVTIAPLTSRMDKSAKQPTHYVLKKASGLRCPSTVLAEQILTLDKRCLIRYLGRVTSSQLRGIDETVKHHLGYYISEQIEIDQSIIKKERKK